MCQKKSIRPTWNPFSMSVCQPSNVIKFSWKILSSMKFARILCVAISILWILNINSSSVHGALSSSPPFQYETSLPALDKNEYQRLLKDFPENKAMVRNLGSKHYQIVNVVQYRHHQAVGSITTREGSGKGPRSQGMQAIATSRVGKHFHRTSFLISAFGHQFRLILELNPSLIAPNVYQKHIFSESSEHRERNELEMCYYHGSVEGLEWSAAAVRTCNGLSAIIHMGNETFIIHPLAGGDMSHKHPHVVIKESSKGRHSCANKRGFEWSMPSGPQYTKGSTFDYTPRRDEDKAPRYFIELAILLDRAMFGKRNGSTRLQVLHDALHIVNIADLYFRKLSTALSVVYVETWHQENHLGIKNVRDVHQTLAQLADYYSPRNLFNVNRDSTMLISGLDFSEAGMGVPMSICTAKAAGVVTDVTVYQPHITAVGLAHMIGHNLNMGHDQDWPGCHCPDWYGCIMSETVIGKDGIQPYRFSNCSLTAFFSSISSGHAMCLRNRPNTIDPIHKTCGNGVVEPGEECDCGSEQECGLFDPCCEPLLCRLKHNAECSELSSCCEKCSFKPVGDICRESTNECDIPEVCTGDSAECPVNTYRKNGSPCYGGTGYCFNGNCPAYAAQCQAIWDWAAKKANDACFQQFNVGGHHTGHCGRDAYGEYKKCSPADVMCGTLHCKEGAPNPTMQSAYASTTFSRIMLKLDGQLHECKNLNSPTGDHTTAQLELVLDGTKCGSDMICMNQTCVKLAPYLDKSKCASNNVGLECSGNGVCSNTNICHCDDGFAGLDCSDKIPQTTTTPSPTSPSVNNESTTSSSAQNRITNRGSADDGSQTIVLVFGMVSVVGGVFILFAMMALCYRRSTVPKYPESTHHSSATPKAFKMPPSQPTHVVNAGTNNSVVGGLATSHLGSQHRTNTDLNHTEEMENRMLSFSQLPTYRDQHNLGMSGSLKNLGGVHGGADEETGDETSAFLGTPNSVAGNRFPEKGILKKYREEDDSQSDNNEGICEVERTLKSLNGYHEDILQALRVAAAQRMGDSNSSPAPQGRLSDGYPEYQEYPSEFPLLRNSDDGMPQGQAVDDESNDEAGGPIRIRNLEDLLRQLEHHSGSGRHLSPCGSEDIRLSETETDRHYRHRSSDHSGFLDEYLDRKVFMGDDPVDGFVLGEYRGPGFLEPFPLSYTPTSDCNNHYSIPPYVSFEPIKCVAEKSGSVVDGYESPSCLCYFCSQGNAHTSTSEEDDDHRSHTSGPHHRQLTRSLTPRSLNRGNPVYHPTADGIRSSSPRHATNGTIPFGQVQPQFFPEYNR